MRPASAGRTDAALPTWLRLEVDLPADLQNARITRSGDLSKRAAGRRGPHSSPVGVVQDVEALAAQLEGRSAIKLEVAEHAHVEPIESRAIDHAAPLIANLEAGGRWSRECRRVEPAQSRLQCLAVAVVRIQHLVRTKAGHARSKNTQTRCII